ncbi:hypothetical protein HNY73_006790 [Argiope bruennichi]|uniref:Uncharacterized protein n=1 Tax=Argiope bruennichi TaxID=94029 RepID=A0A8T0FBX8_ARGBR|nr:hypothetical protein HNY73_006790 [Argiope bruennichi]
MDTIAKSDDIKSCKDAIFYGKKKVAEVRRMLRKDPNSRVLAALEEKAQQELNKLYGKLQILTINQQQGQRNDPDQPAPRPTTKPVVSADSSPEKTSQKSTVATQPDEDMNVDDFIPVSPRKTAKRTLSTTNEPDIETANKYALLEDDKKQEVTHSEDHKNNHHSIAPDPPKHGNPITPENMPIQDLLDSLREIKSMLAEFPGLLNAAKKIKVAKTKEEKKLILINALLE